VLISSLLGFSTSAISATTHQTLAAIHKKFQPASIDKLDAKTQDQIICLSLNLYHEIRGGSDKEINAVGFSTRNRVRATDANYCTTIWSKGQYVWTKRSINGILPHESKSWDKVVDMAKPIVTNTSLPDPTGGANSFFSRKIRAPRWACKSILHKIIGHHVFVKQ
jgi:spore germination cell wall hydrolase CwlJ-like protein